MKPRRLFLNEYYHIYTKSIAGYTIFNCKEEFGRIMEVISLSRFKGPKSKTPLSQLINSKGPKILRSKDSLAKTDALVRIVAYCIMPTHLHFLMQQVSEDGISKFMSRILNSYARYFNLRHHRRGPLLQSRFENIHIENQEHLLHETRYIHLNPVTAYLVEDPADWAYSSYHEYMSGTDNQGLCHFRDLIDMTPSMYRKFVFLDKDNQRMRAKAKKNPNFKLRG